MARVEGMMEGSRESCRKAPGFVAGNLSPGYLETQGPCNQDALKRRELLTRMH